MKQPAIMCC